MMKNTIIYVIAVIAATGGLLFGFDTGVISGAIPFFQKDFGLDNSMVELVTSAGLVGAILGALFCGKITDILGRKVVILASAVIFTIGALWSGFAPSIEQLIIARLFLGIAIGVSSFAVPLYIAEISPANKRGSLVSMFQLMITIGVLASYLSDLMFADEGDMSCWRPMFYIGVVPALILLIGMAFMPESPRWLISRGRDEEGKSVLARIEGNEAMEDSYKTIKNELIKSEKDKCPKCAGTGYTASKKKIKVTIPAGIDNGQSIRIREKGEPGVNGGPRGDLLVEVNVSRHPVFQRVDMNILSTVSISFAIAALGGEIKIPTVDGDVVCTIKPGTKTGTKVRLTGKGVPSLRNSQVRGDHLVTVVIQTPDHLSAEAKEALRRFDELTGNTLKRSENTETAEDKKSKKKSFKEKVKEVFEDKE